VTGDVNAVVLLNSKGLPTRELGPAQVSTLSHAGRVIDVTVSPFPLAEHCDTATNVFFGKLAAARFTTVDERSTAEQIAKAFDEKRAFELEVEVGRRYASTMNFTVRLVRSDALAEINLIASLAGRSQDDEPPQFCALGVRFACGSIST